MTSAQVKMLIVMAIVMLLAVVNGSAYPNPCGNCFAQHPNNDERFRMRMCACFYWRCDSLQHKDYVKPSRKGALRAYTACKCCEWGVTNYVNPLSNDWRERWTRANRSIELCTRMRKWIENRKHFKIQDFNKQMVGNPPICFVKPNRCFQSNIPRPGDHACHTP